MDRVKGQKLGQLYTYQVEVDGKTYHRIRVGFFNTQAEAEDVGKKLAETFGLKTPWVVKPGPEEISTYYKGAK